MNQVIMLLATAVLSISKPELNQDRTKITLDREFISEIKRYTCLHNFDIQMKVKCYEEYLDLLLQNRDADIRLQQQDR